jgi:hypothetical protein
LFHPEDEINKRCSKDLQAAADGYCKLWVKELFLKD